MDNDTRPTLNYISDDEIKTVTPIVLLHIGNGVAAAIGVFLTKNMVDVSPTKKCETPTLEFASIITKELEEPSTEQVGIFHRSKVFEGSLKDQIQATMNDRTTFAMFVGLHRAGTMDALARLARVVGYGEALLFLDKNKDTLLDLMKDIRGV